MLFLPAAALCCLCSALLTMAAQLIQDDLASTKKAGEAASIKCRGFEPCDNSLVYWYIRKDAGTFAVILRYDRSEKKVSKFSHPLKETFSAMSDREDVALLINKCSVEHSATYYCVCNKEAGGSSNDSNSYLIFGTGTKLYVTDKPTVKPEVTVYSGASGAHRGGKSALLCQASGMFPPLVRFSWKRQKKNGPPEELPPGEQLEVKESGRVTAIRVLEHGDIYSYKYYCYVNHEGNMAEEKPREIELPEPPPPPPPPPHWFKERLLCLMYTLLIGKSLVYFCGLSLVSIVRNKKLSGSSPAAD